MCACVCVCLYLWLCVRSLPCSDSCTPSSWMAKASVWWLPSGSHVFHLFSPLLSPPFPYLLCSTLFPPRRLLVSPCFCCPLPFFVRLLYLFLSHQRYSSHHSFFRIITPKSTRSEKACCCSLQNETHLSQLNLHNTLNKKQKKEGKLSRKEVEERKQGLKEEKQREDGRKN